MPPVTAARRPVDGRTGLRQELRSQHGRSYGPACANRRLSTETTWSSRGWTVVLLVVRALADLAGRIPLGADEAVEGRHS